ncbi:hypothetical protein PMALA_008460 [Plasmodium malariae]|nr:hypothetical protein PMALA_008460 [Plasmodium malariae]
MNPYMWGGDAISVTLHSENGMNNRVVRESGKKVEGVHDVSSDNGSSKDKGPLDIDSICRGRVDSNGGASNNMDSCVTLSKEKYFPNGYVEKKKETLHGKGEGIILNKRKPIFFSTNNKYNNDERREGGEYSNSKFNELIYNSVNSSYKNEAYGNNVNYMMNKEIMTRNGSSFVKDNSSNGINSLNVYTCNDAIINVDRTSNILIDEDYKYSIIEDRHKYDKANVRSKHLGNISSSNGNNMSSSKDNNMSSSKDNNMSSSNDNNMSSSKDNNMSSSNDNNNISSNDNNISSSNNAICSYYKQGHTRSKSKDKNWKDVNYYNVMNNKANNDDGSCQIGNLKINSTISGGMKMEAMRNERNANGEKAATMVDTVDMVDVTGLTGMIDGNNGVHGNSDRILYDETAVIFDEEGFNRDSKHLNESSRNSDVYIYGEKKQHSSKIDKQHAVSNNWNSMNNMNNNNNLNNNNMYNNNMHNNNMHNNNMHNNNMHNSSNSNTYNGESKSKIKKKYLTYYPYDRSFNKSSGINANKLYNDSPNDYPICSSNDVKVLSQPDVYTLDDKGATSDGNDLMKMPNQYHDVDGDAYNGEYTNVNENIINGVTYDIDGDNNNVVQNFNQGVDNTVIPHTVSSEEGESANDEDFNVQQAIINSLIDL